MDISAKHNADRMAYLNEDLYRQTLWHHVPLTDFWSLEMERKEDYTN